MILNLLKKDRELNLEEKNVDLIKMISLLIHAAKIDENYTEKEKSIIMNFIEVSSKKELDKKDIFKLMNNAETHEKSSNQILEYTQEVKKMDLETKKLVLEFLWKIILSDEKSDVYESTLMRRICGLLYLPDKLSGEIKLKILNEKN
tara:strand:+ start:1575 stop:2015 length:441 start_codon:yes stop_codon:yes gene_type:complete